MTSRADPAILPGAEAWAHHAPAGTDGPVTTGVLVLHGFTGNPSSMRGFAEAMAGAGFHVEMPRLPGHGTTVEDMITTGWADWSAEVEAAYGRLAERAERIVVAGLSMGGALTLWLGLAHPEIAGLVCVNPATTAQPADVRQFLADTLAGGTDVMPGIGSDIADPEASESAYEGMPLRAAAVVHRRRAGPDAGPLRRAGDAAAAAHVARGPRRAPRPTASYLAEHYGGPVDHRWLERSYHVATLDFDRDVIFLDAVEFVAPRHGVLTVIAAPRVGRPGQHPQPVVGHADDRPAQPQRLRPDDRPRRRRRGVAVRPAPRAEGHRHPRGRQRHRRCGASSPASSAPGSTTCSPTGSATRDNLGDVVKIWEGGLGIPGGMLAGVLVGGYVGHVKRGIPLGAGLNAVAPALPLAQAIGRWGNYFNQELYGRATDPAVGPGDRRRPPAGRPGVPAGHACSTRRSSTSRCGTSPCAGC